SGSASQSVSQSGSLLQITNQVHRTKARERIRDLEKLPLPARDLFDHSSYQRYYKQHYGRTMTHMMCSRGCPFSCNFCSKPVFGNIYRNRSASAIVDEIEDIQTYGYERVWFSDDIFPINKRLVEDVSSEIIRRGLDVEWGCLCRSDLMNQELARKMKRGGCFQVFFGLESGNDQVLKLMNKAITVDQSRIAVNSCVDAGIKVGGFFILGYPGENNKTMLDTIKFASSLPLDYFSFTVPYPIPGTKLYETVLHRMVTDEWVKPKGEAVDQKLIWASDFSEQKLKFGIRKARIQGSIRKKIGPGYYLLGKPIELVTDQMFKLMK
ncbi:MAG: B12-binding domain-containing radical SAM protein, partial [Nitrososphaerales archaeon]